MVLKYIKIYFIFLNNELKLAFTYRFSFITELLVENGYNFLWLFLILFLYKSSVNFPLFTRAEAITLTGLNFITTEIILSTCYIMNLFNLPEKISSGEIDYLLTKPINSLFALNLSRPYIAGFLSILPGVILLFISVPQLSTISFVRLIIASFISLCGIIMAICIGIMATSLAFKFPNTRQIPRAAAQVFSELKSNPHTIYSGFASVLFTFILPINFIASIPVFYITHNLSHVLIIAPFIMTIIFIYLCQKIWNISLRHYSSASS